MGNHFLECQPKPAINQSNHQRQKLTMLGGARSVRSTGPTGKDWPRIQRRRNPPMSAFWGCALFGVGVVVGLVFIFGVPQFETPLCRDGVAGFGLVLMF